MVVIMQITSKQNPKIKALVGLRQRRDRDTAGLFLIEGYREVRRALDKTIGITELYYCPEWFLGDNEQALINDAQQSGAILYELSKEVFAKVSYRDRPDGLLAVAKQWQRSLDDLKLSPKPFLMVVEAVEKPGNLGTILRTADGAGADGVIVCDPVTDIFNPNVVRSSTGVLFSVPVVVTDSQTLFQWLRQKKIHIVATTPAAEKLYTKTDLTGPIAVVMGSEQYGLTDFWLEQCDLPVRIPMAGQADSLNVAISAAVVAYEVVRQREV
jgi:RNA methyltransferase, TrmH family